MTAPATKFDLAQFDMGYGRERYVMYGPDRMFIGRFKYSRAAACAKHFVKFLIANFTVEEYLEGLQTPNPKFPRNKLAPAEVLRTKGFVDYNTLQAMKQGGYATEREMMDAIMAAHDARRAAA